MEAKLGVVSGLLSPVGGKSPEIHPWRSFHSALIFFIAHAGGIFVLYSHAAGIQPFRRERGNR